MAKRQTSMSECPSCGQQEWEQSGPAARDVFTIWRCTGCGLLRSEGTPRHGTGEDEFSKINLDVYFESMVPVRRQSSQDLLKSVEEQVKPGDFLDIGCSFGWLLDEAQLRGWQTYGIEPSDLAVEHLRKRGKHEVAHGVFPSAGFGEQKFDAVAMTDVLEHLPEPVETLRQIIGILKPGGILVVRVPNNEGMAYFGARTLRRLTGGKADEAFWRMWQFDFPYPHLWYFHPKSLQNTFHRAGYEVIVSRTEPVVTWSSIGQRVSYVDGGGKTPNIAGKLRNLVLTAGLAGCFLGSRVSGRDDICLVLARPR